MAQMHYYLIVRDLLQSFTKLLTFMRVKCNFAALVTTAIQGLKGPKPIVMHGLEQVLL